MPSYRLSIDKLSPCVHGGINYTELNKLGIPPYGVLDFSVSINPFGPPPGISESLSSISLENYPDPESTELRTELAAKLGISPDNIVVGSGSTELIRLVTTAFLDRDDPVIIPVPTYGEYQIAGQLSGAQIIPQPVLRPPDFRLDIDETIKLIRKHRPKIIFICNPNNPTGQYLSKQDLNNIMSNISDGLIVLDEAYVAFTENAWTSTDLIDSGNLIILRSMTKDYALAGLRLGYALASEPIISILRRVLPPWNVNSVAQKAGILVLQSDMHLKGCFNKIKKSKKFLINELERLGFVIVPSQTNFFLVHVGDATGFRQKLLSKGILVRDCTSFGLAEYIRLSLRSIPECQRLIEGIKESGVSSDDG